MALELQQVRKRLWTRERRKEAVYTKMGQMSRRVLGVSSRQPTADSQHYYYPPFHLPVAFVYFDAEMVPAHSICFLLKYVIASCRPPSFVVTTRRRLAPSPPRSITYTATD